MARAAKKWTFRTLPGGPGLRIQCLHGWVLGSIHGWDTKILKAAWHSRNKKLKNKTNQQPSLALVLFPRRAFLLGVYFFLDICHPSLPPLLCFFFTLCFFLLFSALSPLFPLSLHFSASSPVFVTRPEPGHLFIWKLELRKEVKISPGTLKQRRGILYSLSWSKDDPSFLPLHKIHFGVYRPVILTMTALCFSLCAN